MLRARRTSTELELSGTLLCYALITCIMQFFGIVDSPLLQHMVLSYIIFHYTTTYSPFLYYVIFFYNIQSFPMFHMILYYNLRFFPILYYFIIYSSFASSLGPDGVGA